MKKTLSAAVLLLGLQGMVAAQPMPSLKELINSAQQQDATLKQQTLENQLTRLDDEKLKDVFLPKIELSGKSGYLYSSATLRSPEITIPAVASVFPGMVIPEGQLDNNLHISGISALADAKASVLLYSGGKVKYLKEANKEKSLSETMLMEKSRDEIATVISKIYDQFALLNESANVLEKGKERLEIMKKTADKALGYGLITPYDHKKIELAQATLDSKIIEYEGKKELLITQLSLLTGIEKELLVNLQPQLAPVYPGASGNTIQERAEIKALTHGINAADYKIKAEQRWWVPKVMAQTSASYFGLYNNRISTSDPLLPGTGKKLDWRPANIHVRPIIQAGVGFKWDIFDGKEGKNATARARVEKQILENKMKDAQDKLQLNLANNETNYRIANAQIALKEKAREIAATALTNIEKEFRYGTKKSSDYIDAENDLENAELEYQAAIFNQRRAAVELMKATQSLDIDKL
ncbi:TolC family protein [Niabella aquatica]